MHVLYLATLLLAFLPRFGPNCEADKVYPPCMNWTACLFIINFIFHMIINNRKDYFFDSGSIIEEEGDKQRDDAYTAVGDEGKTQ